MNSKNQKTILTTQHINLQDVLYDHIKISQILTFAFSTTPATT